MDLPGQVGLTTGMPFPQPLEVPLIAHPDGAIRVRGSRVLLDTIVTAFPSGAIAEEIVQQFPGVALADVDLVIGHYLTHSGRDRRLPFPAPGGSH